VNDKIDYSKLPRPSLPSEALKAAPAPNGDLAELLLTICSEVLSNRVDNLSSSFFEIGGNSLSILKVIARLEKYSLTVDPKLFLQGASLREIARKIQAKTDSRQTTESGGIPPTPFQLNQFLRKFPDYWHRSLLLELGEGLKADLLAKAVEHLVQSKPELRLTWDRDTTQWRYSAAGHKIFSFHDFSGLSRRDSEKEIISSIEEHRRSLRLDRYPLLRVAYFARNDTKSLLFIVIHGLIADTYSWSLLLEEIQEIYRHLDQKADAPKLVSSSGFQAFATRLQALMRSPESQKRAQEYLATRSVRHSN
jgi:hypothetical protein